MFFCHCRGVVAFLVLLSAALGWFTIGTCSSIYYVYCSTSSTSSRFTVATMQQQSHGTRARQTLVQVYATGRLPKLA
ncbi:hypothetical protein PR003_g21215 [Phytophthora rubi]|uniref:Secreted protein n=1 Tax=Phytophthora rubi TaxID=129364 RepID=A0A6A3JFE5_9STRA|nr:hypothetical protein PR002_g21856 [Phytophthora rubi]KAE8992902.1 hypothetical protein PR001_g20812 [Phytophthora rubi]KAE9306544.1 hypothetical protein PR003_g21215 [Phytophthora rubi]